MMFTNDILPSKPVINNQLHTRKYTSISPDLGVLLYDMYGINFNSEYVTCVKPVEIPLMHWQEYYGITRIIARLLRANYSLLSSFASQEYLPPAYLAVDELPGNLKELYNNRASTSEQSLILKNFCHHYQQFCHRTKCESRYTAYTPPSFYNITTAADLECYRVLNMIARHLVIRRTTLTQGLPFVDKEWHKFVDLVATQYIRTQADQSTNTVDHMEPLSIRLAMYNLCTQRVSAEQQWQNMYGKSVPIERSSRAKLQPLVTMLAKHTHSKYNKDWLDAVDGSLTEVVNIGKITTLTLDVAQSVDIVCKQINNYIRLRLKQASADAVILYDGKHSTQTPTDKTHDSRKDVVMLDDKGRVIKPFCFVTVAAPHVTKAALKTAQRAGKEATASKVLTMYSNPLAVMRRGAFASVQATTKRASITVLGMPNAMFYTALALYNEPLHTRVENSYEKVLPMDKMFDSIRGCVMATFKHIIVTYDKQSRAVANNKSLAIMQLISTGDLPPDSSYLTPAWLNVEHGIHLPCIDVNNDYYLRDNLRAVYNAYNLIGEDSKRTVGSAHRRLVIGTKDHADAWCYGLLMFMMQYNRLRQFYQHQTYTQPKPRSMGQLITQYNNNQAHAQYVPDWLAQLPMASLYNPNSTVMIQIIYGLLSLLNTMYHTGNYNLHLSEGRAKHMRYMDMSTTKLPQWLSYNQQSVIQAANVFKEYFGFAAPFSMLRIGQPETPSR